MGRLIEIGIGNRYIGRFLMELASAKYGPMPDSNYLIVKFHLKRLNSCIFCQSNILISYQIHKINRRDLNDLINNVFYY